MADHDKISMYISTGKHTLLKKYINSKNASNALILCAKHSIISCIVFILDRFQLPYEALQASFEECLQEEERGIPGAYMIMNAGFIPSKEHYNHAEKISQRFSHFIHRAIYKTYVGLQEHILAKAFISLVRRIDTDDTESATNAIHDSNYYVGFEYNAILLQVAVEHQHVLVISEICSRIKNDKLENAGFADITIGDILATNIDTTPHNLLCLIHNAIDDEETAIGHYLQNDTFYAKYTEMIKHLQ